MGRAINVVLFAAMIAGAVVTYDMKHDAEVAAADLARLQAEVAKEKETIALLKAELSLLTQPARIQSVVAAHDGYFKLVPFTPDHIGTIDEIPFRPIAAHGSDKPNAAGPAVTGPIRLATP